jgi:hypothetical protein
MAVTTDLFPSKKCVKDVTRILHINETRRERKEIK